VDGLYDPELVDLARTAVGRLRRRLRAQSPTLAKHVAGWMRSLSGGAPPERYFTHPQAFPMLLLPWWLELTIRGSVVHAFQREIVYSTLSGYYFVRLIDDAMDAQPPPEPELLPALIVLHTEFQHAYHRYFPFDHPFWAALLDSSYEAAEMASRDARRREIDRAEFIRVSSRKISGAMVPIAAVCHHHRRPDLIGPWSDMVRLLGQWHQMGNDIFDWRRDLERGTATYFLSEASRRSGADGSILEWAMAEGLAWGMGELRDWMEKLQTSAATLDSPALMAYLAWRRQALEAEWLKLRAGLEPLQRLAAVIG